MRHNLFHIVFWISILNLAFIVVKCNYGLLEIS